jgi:hypothetical protein
LFTVCFIVWENAGMPENYILMMDFEYQLKVSKKSISGNI